MCREASDCGIYKLSIGPFYYIGQSVEIKKRWHRHVTHLGRGIHTNRAMQQVFDALNEIKEEVVLLCPEAELSVHEQELINSSYYDPYCLNLELQVQSLIDAANLRSKAEKTKINRRLELEYPDGTVETFKALTHVCEKFRQSTYTVWHMDDYKLRYVDAETGVELPKPIYKVNVEHELKKRLVALQLESFLAAQQKHCI